MREILFRGKSKDSEKWLYGGFCYGNNNGEARICPQYDFSQEVLSETIGQWTGVTDRNGNKIFEGDIVNPNAIIFGGLKGIIKWVSKKGCYAIYFKDKPYHYEDITKAEVIGNIHDNPELLKD